MHQGSHRDSFYLVKQTDENNTCPLLFLSKITKTHEKQNPLLIFYAIVIFHYSFEHFTLLGGPMKS
jgi:hypothetical protein